jgi:hypothetical protein
VNPIWAQADELDKDLERAIDRQLGDSPHNSQIYAIATWLFIAKVIIVGFRLLAREMELLRDVIFISHDKQ